VEVAGYRFQSRGAVMVKGKGLMQTYFVEPAAGSTLLAGGTMIASMLGSSTYCSSTLLSCSTLGRGTSSNRSSGETAATHLSSSVYHRCVEEAEGADSAVHADSAPFMLSPPAQVLRNRQRAQQQGPSSF